MKSSKNLLLGKPGKFFLLFRSLFIVLSFLCLLVLGTNCVQQNEEGPARTARKDDGPGSEHRTTLIRHLSMNPQYLNPVLAYDVPSAQITGLIFESLLEIDNKPEINLVGRLAEKWQISEDGKTITFFLRSGITWQDGRPFTAEDVKFTFDIAQRKDVPAYGLKSIVETLEQVRVLNPKTVCFDFKYLYSPGLLNVGLIPVVPKHRLDEHGLVQEKKRRNLDEPVTFFSSDFKRNPIGTGPYILHEWKESQLIRLVRNENYWDKRNFPPIKNVLFKIISSSVVAFNILQKGDLDVFRAKPDQLLRFQRLQGLKYNYKLENFYAPQYSYIGWNMRPKRIFFTSKKVRRAMTYALDRESFINKVRHGLGKIISGPFYVKSWAYNPGVKPIPYDLEKAAELLESEGWKDHDADGVLDKGGVKFCFELSVSAEDEGSVQLASILQSNLKILGIEVTIRVYEWSVFVERVRTAEFEACVLGWGLRIDPDPYEYWHSSQIQAGNNFVGYVNEEVDKLIEQGRREFDRQKRQQIYWKVHQLIHDDQPYTFVFTPMTNYILAKRIENYQISPFGLFAFFPGQLSWSLH